MGSRRLEYWRRNSCVTRDSCVTREWIKQLDLKLSGRVVRRLTLHRPLHGRPVTSIPEARSHTLYARQVFPLISRR